MYEADLQPEEGQSLDYVAVDKSVIRLNDLQYWLYTAVEPETSELLYRDIKPTRISGIVCSFICELRGKYDTDGEFSRRWRDTTKRRVPSTRPQCQIRTL